MRGSFAAASREVDGPRFASGAALLLAVLAIFVPYLAGIVFALASLGFAARLVRWSDAATERTVGLSRIAPILGVLAFTGALALFFLGPDALERVRGLVLAFSASLFPVSPGRRPSWPRGR